MIYSSTYCWRSLTVEVVAVLAVLDISSEFIRDRAGTVLLAQSLVISVGVIRRVLVQYYS